MTKEELKSILLYREGSVWKAKLQEVLKSTAMNADMMSYFLGIAIHPEDYSMWAEKYTDYLIESQVDAMTEEELDASDDLFEAFGIKSNTEIC